MKIIFLILACCMPFLNGMEKSISKERLQKSKRLSYACLPPASTVVEGKSLIVKDAALNSWQLMSQLSALRSQGIESAHIENSNLSVVLPELIGLQSLNKVFLKNNNYLFYVPDIFALDNLTSLIVVDQNATDLFSHSSTLGHLEELSIEKGSLQEIPEIVTQSSSLRKLILRNNDIATIDVPIRSHQLPSSLELLDLSYNNLVELGTHLQLLTNLRSLIIAGNGLEAIPDYLSEHPSLTRINCSNNNLCALPKYFLKSFKDTNQGANYLDFSHNFITKISKKCVDKTSSSTPSNNTPRGYVVRVSLKLNNNLLTSVKYLYGFDALAELDLSSNDLKKISSKISACGNLQILKLNNNNLKKLPDSLCELKRLRYLSIMDNPGVKLSKALRLYILKLCREMRFEYYSGTLFPNFPKVVKNTIYGYIAGNQ